ncbi:MAG: hypothetical protein QM754_05435 [Tepidisphaeraceae bacterium]
METDLVDDARKYAYRYLIYWALLDIRPVRNLAYGSLTLLNPFRLTRNRKQLKQAGDLASWLHNAAQFSAFDFSDFDEDRFWKQHAALAQEHPELQHCRAAFERALSEHGR